MQEYINGTSIPAHLLGNASAMDRVADSGFYYLYSPALAIHRVQQQDGCPHIYPNRVRVVNDFAKWFPLNLAAQTSAVANRTTIDRTGKPQQEIANAEYAGSIVSSILDGETGWGRKAVVKLEAFSQRKPEELDLDYFNDLICPLPIVFQRTDPNARFDDVDPKLKKKIAEIPEAIYREIAEVGALNVRRRFVLEARTQLESNTLGIPSHITPIYLAAIREILPSFDLFRQWGNSVLSAKDKVVSGSAGKVAYDELDNELQWLLARKGVDNYLTEAVNKTPVVNLTLPEGYGQAQASPTSDIQREPCLTCGELIAVTAKKCRYCNEAVVKAAAVAVGADVVTVVEAKQKGKGKNAAPEKVTDDDQVF